MGGEVPWWAVCAVKGECHTRGTDNNTVPATLRRLETWLDTEPEFWLVLKCGGIKSNEPNLVSPHSFAIVLLVPGLSALEVKDAKWGLMGGSSPPL